jgi:hypothetical protein
LIGKAAAFVRRNKGSSAVVASVIAGAGVALVLAADYRWFDAQQAGLGILRLAMALLLGAGIVLVGALCAYAITYILGSATWAIMLAAPIIGWKQGKLLGAVVGLLLWLMLYFLFGSLREHVEGGSPRARVIMGGLGGGLTAMMVCAAFEEISRSFT